jgi:hypothetical protein
LRLPNLCFLLLIERRQNRFVQRGALRYKA